MQTKTAKTDAKAIVFAVKSKYLDLVPYINLNKIQIFGKIARKTR